MINQARMYEPENKTDNVIQLSSDDKSFKSENDYYKALWENAFKNKEIIKHLKSIVEGIIMDIYIKEEQAVFTRSDNPFDAIYLSELKADKINIDDVSEITKYSNIKDLSNTISFDDEWEE